MSAALVANVVNHDAFPLRLVRGIRRARVLKVVGVKRHAGGAGFGLISVSTLKLVSHKRFISHGTLASLVISTDNTSWNTTQISCTW